MNHFNNVFETLFQYIFHLTRNQINISSNNSFVWIWKMISRCSTFLKDFFKNARIKINSRLNSLIIQKCFLQNSVQIIFCTVFWSNNKYQGLKLKIENPLNFNISDYIKLIFYAILIFKCFLTNYLRF